MTDLLHRQEMPPNDKFEYPMTDSQEIGWFVRPEVGPFHKPSSLSLVLS
jgi:hypothetical protein